MDTTELYSYVGRKAMLTVLSRPEATRTVRTKTAEADVTDKQVLTCKPSLGIRIPVRIDDARMAYGRPQVLIHPIAGEGSAWVRIDRRLRVLNENEEWPASAPDPENMPDKEDVARETTPVDVSV